MGMKKHAFAPLAAILISTIVLLVMFCVFSNDAPGMSTAALAAPMQTSPTVTQVDPTSAPNDLDIPIVITGTGFTAELSGTLVITPPAAYLGDTALVDVTWVSSATLEASVPWGMDLDVYTLTVVNPAGEAGSLTEAFTVTQGINTWTTGGPYGGWVEYLALGDEQGEIVYAILMNVGLFRSRDGGESWELLFIEIGHENRVEVDRSNPDRLYIAKPGEVERQAGLYRSEDGGDSWTAMPQPIPGTGINGFFAFVNPHNGTLFGALLAGPGDFSCNWGCGLFRFDETDQTWIRLEEAGLLDGTTPVSAMGFDPHDPNTMYAGLVGGLVLKSVDGGETWFSHSQSPLDYIRELVVNRVGGELWICSPGGLEPGGLYRYDGDEWVSMYTSPYEVTTVRNIVLDPNATDVQTQHIWIAADGVLKSEDGGRSWTSLLSIQAEAIALNPLHPETIYGGSPGGVDKTGDGGIGWQRINEGLTGIVPSYMDVNPRNPAIVYGVFAGVYGSQTGGKVWQQLHVESGGSGPVVVDPADPQHVVCGTSISDDGWNFNREFTIPMPPERDEPFYGQDITAIAAVTDTWLMGVGYIDTRLPYKNYEGGGGIYFSEDGENWTWVGPLLDYPPTGFGFDPVDENILYAATPGGEEGRFLRSTDKGQTWQVSADGLEPATSGDGLIAIEPTLPHRIYLTSGGGLYVSSNQGLTWTGIDQNGLPGVHISSLLYLKGSPNILYAGTSYGLFRSMDGAQTWQPAQGAMGQLEIWSLAGTTIDDRQILYVALVGGAVENDGSQAQGLASGNEQLINAGVYRFTTLSMSQRIYLPLVLRH
jgi:photosystem II stability/assembly factor-like uncharacterized protein